jgi:hypothetical protein
MTPVRKTAQALACVVLLCIAAGQAQGDGNTAISKDEAKAFLAREKALPEGCELSATWLQATGVKNEFAQAVAVGTPGNASVTVRYIRNGRLLDDAEAMRLGLNSVSTVSPEGRQAPMTPGTTAHAAQKRPVPRLSREDMRQAPRTVLGAPDMKRVAKEDAEAVPGEKAMRIGVFQDLTQPLEAVAGIKRSAAKETVWAAAITSPGALGQRIAFDNLTLAPGAEIILYDAAAPGSAIGPLDTANVGEWPYWAPACPGETVIIECRFPTMESAQAFSLTITKVAHIYRDPLKEATEKGLAGTCNKDVTCRPEWADFALAVGGLGIIDTSGVLFCTCTLLADANPCLTLPFALTANHCVRGQTGFRGADSLEFYWQYQSSECDGAVPALLTVPRTVGGADYLAGMTGNGTIGGGSDFTFLRLRNEPPANLPRMGWTTAPPPIGTPVVCVHHPRGDFKRITDGALSDVSNTYPEWYHEVTWNLGTTEPGSSGSPLAVAATGQIIGQLWGGEASCSLPTAPDYYGRFDRSYTAIRSFLEPPAAFMVQSAAAADEDAGAADISVSLSRPADGPTDVLVTAEPGTALPGRDYVDSPQTLHFDKGQTTQSCSYPTLPNVRLDGDHAFTLRLSSPAGCITPIDGQTTTTVTLFDNDVDSDGDRLSDGEETTLYGTDPQYTDSDRDGLLDGDEVYGRSGYVTDPALHDTDGDGLSDYMEILTHLNPLDPTDVPKVSSLTIPWATP